MPKRVIINGWKAPTVSDNGNSMLLPVRTADGEELELIFGHDFLPRFVDWGASGWNVSAQRMGRPSDERLTFELEGIEVGNVVRGGDKDGTVVITMQFGDSGSVSYTANENLAWALLDALKAQLEPDTLPGADGSRH